MNEFRSVLSAAALAVALAVACLSAAGCVTYPHPHDVVELSPVSGTLRLDGEDVADWAGWNFMRRADLETEYGTQRGDAGI